MNAMVIARQSFKLVQTVVTVFHSRLDERNKWFLNNSNLKFTESQCVALILI